VSKKRKQCVEVDGSAHDSREQQEYDRHKDDVLRGHGYNVIRFRNEHVLTDIKSVLSRLGIKP
jgi:very-short-patch-repair endonuclease